MEEKTNSETECYIKRRINSGFMKEVTCSEDIGSEAINLAKEIGWKLLVKKGSELIEKQKEGKKDEKN